MTKDSDLAKSDIEVTNGALAEDEPEGSKAMTALIEHVQRMRKLKMYQPSHGGIYPPGLFSTDEVSKYPSLKITYTKVHPLAALRENSTYGKKP